MSKRLRSRASITLRNKRLVLIKSIVEEMRRGRRGRRVFFCTKDPIKRLHEDYALAQEVSWEETEIVRSFTEKGKGIASQKLGDLMGRQYA